MGEFCLSIYIELFSANYALYFWRIMHQKFPFMCELCNIFKQICLLRLQIFF